MDKKQRLQRLFSKSKDKNKFLEELIFCEYADERDFENYFRIEELEESELFCLISFLYHQDCFLMMMDIMNQYQNRFLSYNESLFDEIDFSEKLISRLERMENGTLINNHNA